MTASDLKTLLADHQLYHSEFQMDHLITVRAGGTPFGQYKQSLRELFKRYRGLKELYVARERLRLRIRSPIRRVLAFLSRRVALGLLADRMSMEDLERNVADTEREFLRFHGQAAALKATIGELSPERRAVLDREMWRHKLRAMAAVDMVTTGGLRENTITFLQASPPPWRRELLGEVHAEIEARRQGHEGPLLTWYLNYDAPLPEPQIERADVKALLSMDGGTP